MQRHPRKISLACREAITLAVLLGALGSGAAVLAVEPRPNWGDSVSDGDQCYCDTTYDHDIGGVLVDTPAGPRTVRQVCERIGPAPDTPGLPVYNDVQCGNGPANNAGDEDADVCPGRVDQGEAGCAVIGPTWQLERHFLAEPTEPTVPVTQPEGGEATMNELEPTDPARTDEAGEPATVPEPTGPAGPSALAPPFEPTEPTEPTEPREPREPPAPSALDRPAGLELAEGLILDAPAFSSADDRWQTVDDTYLELLPDLRVGVDDPPGPGSFWGRPEEAPQVHYTIDVARPGRYEVYSRSRTSGPLDESAWVGVDGIWSSVSFDGCERRDGWFWSVCPDTPVPTVQVRTAGVHTLMIAGRDDGYEFDRLFLRGPLARDEAGEPAAAKPVTVGGGGVHPLWVSGLLLANVARRRRSVARGPSSRVGHPGCSWGVCSR